MGAISNAFEVPQSLNAKVPAELRGKGRDDVRLMVMDGEGVYHDRFSSLPDFLEKGDLLIFNNSRTIPAVLKAKACKHEVEIRLSRQLDGQTWEALIWGGLFSAGYELELEKGVKAVITGNAAEKPLVTISFSVKGAELMDYIYSYGEPIRYEYIDSDWPLDAYQTAYASVPGSVEMASAGRAFSWKMLRNLKGKGIKTAFLTLHTGLSYYGKDRWPDPNKHPEAFHIPEETAELINSVREAGGRVIAVGTTVVRALETAADESGRLHTATGITNLYIKKEYKLKAVDGLVTGLHEPEATHLEMLSAFASPHRLFTAYREALKKGYLWHEFGDINLILSERAHS
ncbi:S-adenosylmethionine:tRNA ribosyltransferase-isomerase [Rossellomorea vietnamensis]|uniref:S-adenosylmethionine:tRNA ribosyltransferase-isomerase n=1 Tax=Rossellomorea vietnamensis TaxID=218284 RepID=A0A5D4MBJ5_9BACI|nr:S-adenosylmethionine:tRNA ribosyltransferase-isomerase [Rossellomorea vietnamensis]TYR98683.1 S-adenosylmethionine:tRNA ribosyltransferase-isomerase [Rossellomorea vietnamensis]